MPGGFRSIFRNALQCGESVSIVQSGDAIDTKPDHNPVTHSGYSLVVRESCESYNSLPSSQLRVALTN